MIEYPADYCPTMSKRPVCGVMASAICAKVNFDVAFAAAKRTNHSKRFRGGMHFDHLARCLEELGVNFRFASNNEGFQLQHWVALRCEPDQTYIIMVTGHYVTVRNGHVADQGYNGPLEKSRNRRSKVLGWVRIISANPIELELAA